MADFQGRGFFVVLLMTVYCLSAPVPDDRYNAIKYLIQYKYLNTPDEVVEPTVFKLSLEKFQRNNGLDVTGTLNSATLSKMRNLTCRESESRLLEGQIRTRRFTVAQNVRWTKRDVTYNVVNAAPGLSKQQTDAVFKQAFDAWQNICGLTLSYSEAHTADIIIIFFRGSHGDGQQFDGPGGILGHAFLPLENGAGIYGDIHMDSEEHWVLEGGGKNLYQVALHEIGHALALGHSIPNSVMHAMYNPIYDPNFRFQTDDIMGAQFLYGPNDGAEMVTGMITNPGSNMPDDTCVQSVDAITTLTGDSVLVFMGQEVFKMSTKGSIEDGYPKLLTDVFGDISNSVSKIDAAVRWPSGILYLFVGSQYYRYSSFESTQPWPLDNGYPKLIADNWDGIPNDVDSATITPDNEFYFFKGNQFFKFGYHEDSYQILPDYPRLITSNPNWAALAAVDIRAAMLWSDGNYYLFTDDNFYVMHAQYEFLFPSYPRSFKEEWFACDIME